MTKHPWTKEVYAEFDKLTRKESSGRQMDRIESRIKLPLFIAEHGKELCDAMFAHLMKASRR